MIIFETERHVIRVTLFFIVLLNLMTCTFSMSSTLQCYVGTGTTQVNTTCNLKKKHYKSMKGVDYVLETDDPVSLKNSISHCLLFNPHNGKKVDTDDTFLCDEQKVCSGLKENIWLTKVRSNKVLGNAYCCSTDLCNKPAVMSSLAFKQNNTISEDMMNNSTHDNKTHIQCYSNDVKDTGNLRKCSSMCVLSTWLTSSVINDTAVGNVSDNNHTTDVVRHDRQDVEQHCDTDLICEKYHIENGCKMISHNLTHSRQLCCCNTSLCNKKMVNSKIIAHQGTDTQPRSDSLHEHHSATSIVRSGSLSWMFLSAVCGLILISSCVGMIVIGIYRYTKRRRDNMTYMYSELTAELGEEPRCDHDVGLLVP